MSTVIFWQFGCRSPYDFAALQQHATECIEAWVTSARENTVEVTWSSNGGTDSMGKRWQRQPHFSLVRLEFPTPQQAVMFKMGYMDDNHPCLRF